MWFQSKACIVQMSEQITSWTYKRSISVGVVIETRSSAVAKRPCDRCVGQFWRNITGRVEDGILQTL